MRKDEFHREARSDLSGPLEGVRVVEVTTTWAGPMCGCLLADFGADVVKVEHPGGEVARHLAPFVPGTDPPAGFMHATLNRNKRSLTLDLRAQAGREVYLRLVRDADVVVENFRPGALDGFGVGWEAVRSVRPDVVYVSISGFGQYGPESERAGYDPLAQAASGWMSLNGEPEGGPLKAPTFLADDLAGLHAALAALAALRHRDRTGEGQHVDVSLLDVLLFQSCGYPALAAMGVDLPRLGNQFRIAVPANVYPARDGLVMIGVVLDSHWRRLAAAMGRPELAEHPDWATAAARVARREHVDRLVADWVGARSAEEVTGVLLDAGLPASRVLTYAEAAASEHVRERELLARVPVDGGAEAPTVAPPVKLSRTPTAVRSGPPALGADTDAILEELGFDAAARRRLRESGAI